MSAASPFVGMRVIHRGRELTEAERARLQAERHERYLEGARKAKATRQRKRMEWLADPVHWDAANAEELAFLTRRQELSVDRPAGDRELDLEGVGGAWLVLGDLRVGLDLVTVTPRRGLHPHGLHVLLQDVEPDIEDARARRWSGWSRAQDEQHGDHYRAEVWIPVMRWDPDDASPGNQNLYAGPYYWSELDGEHLVRRRRQQV